jgi:hypothetical protein
LLSGFVRPLASRGRCRPGGGSWMAGVVYVSVWLRVAPAGPGGCATGGLAPCPVVGGVSGCLAGWYRGRSGTARCVVWVDFGARGVRCVFAVVWAARVSALCPYLPGLRVLGLLSRPWGSQARPAVADVGALARSRGKGVWAAWSVWSPLARGVLGVRGDVCLGLFSDGLGGSSLPGCRCCHAWASGAGGIGRPAPAQG